MKSINSELLNYLLNNDTFQCSDLYGLELKDGTKYFFTDYDIDIAYNGQTYQSNWVIVERGGTKTSGKPSVDSMNVTLNVDNDTTIKGIPFIKAVHDGVLDGANLSISRAFFDTDGSLLGVIREFLGRVQIDDCYALTVNLTVKSEILGLGQTFPLRAFSPQTAYVIEGDNVVESKSDSRTCVIPLKPNKSALLRF